MLTDVIKVACNVMNPCLRWECTHALLIQSVTGDAEMWYRRRRCYLARAQQPPDSATYKLVFLILFIACIYRLT